MVLPDKLRPGNDRRLLRNILDVLRDFDVVHKKKIGRGVYGQVDFDEKKIYISRHEGFEDDNTFLHEIRHVFRNFYSRKDDFDEEEHERDAEIGSVRWYQKIYENPGEK